MVHRACRHLHLVPQSRPAVLLTQGTHVAAVTA